MGGVRRGGWRSAGGGGGGDNRQRSQGERLAAGSVPPTTATWYLAFKAVVGRVGEGAVKADAPDRREARRSFMRAGEMRHLLESKLLPPAPSGSGE